MAIVATDLKMYLSGGAGNATPAASLGGIISTTEVTNNSLNDLWDDVSGTEAAAGGTEYRCIYVKNTHATLSLTLSKFWIDTQTTASGDAITVGLDLAGVNATANTIANETTAPNPAVTFITAVDKANGLDTGTVAAGQRYGIWIKRVVNAGAGAATSNSYILKWEGDTAA
jgi:hypothetical protein